MQREIIIQKLKEEGCRITKQRLMLIDIILKEECTSCKEIYYKALKLDKNIGTATVYRLIHTLEKIGAISRKNLYKVICSEGSADGKEHVCTVELDDNTVYNLSLQKWNAVVRSGLKECGYIKDQKLRNIIVKQEA